MLSHENTNSFTSFNVLCILLSNTMSNSNHITSTNNINNWRQMWKKKVSGATLVLAHPHAHVYDGIFPEHVCNFNARRTECHGYIKCILVCVCVWCTHAESESGRQRGAAGARSSGIASSSYREFYMCGTAKSQHEVSVRNLELNYICNSSSAFFALALLLLLLICRLYALLPSGALVSCIEKQCNFVCLWLLFGSMWHVLYPYFNFHMELSSFSSLLLIRRNSEVSACIFWYCYSFGVTPMWLTELCLSSKSIYNWNQLYCMHIKCAHMGHHAATKSTRRRCNYCLTADKRDRAHGNMNRNAGAHSIGILMKCII